MSLLGLADDIFSGRIGSIMLRWPRATMTSCRTARPPAAGAVDEANGQR
jgi:hypothetical protein